MTGPLIFGAGRGDAPTRSAGFSAGQFDLGLFGVGSIEDHGVPDEATQVGAAPFGQGLGVALLVVRAEEPDLDQFMVEQGFVEGSYD